MPIPKDSKLQKRMSAKERALEQLRIWIIDGTIEPGEKLYDGEIAESIGISRTPVREALQILQHEGFVIMQPGKATIVSSIEKEDVLKIYPPHAALHSLAAEEAAGKITSEQIEKLNKINREYDSALHQNDSVAAMELDEKFHDLILTISDNPFILDFCSILQLHIRRFKYIFLNQHMEGKNDSINEHQIIIQAFSGKNPKLASEIMKQNWLRPMNQVYSVLAEGKK
ncbi:GntR family transcriptional regulator [Peribacillus saganii]|uniref:GntR family transcriptional regulator n=1 Tax=Peribacillus saganii TaxID=2303992 RepID=A0A372LR52_9BACI|nr:GntR family transcriptional regulator [Peribacillus saganii]RFU70675.1 GntR family transcriptional regulator [Peribacillus saganii]